MKTPKGYISFPYRIEGMDENAVIIAKEINGKICLYKLIDVGDGCTLIAPVIQKRPSKNTYKIPLLS